MSALDDLIKKHESGYSSQGGDSPLEKLMASHNAQLFPQSKKEESEKDIYDIMSDVGSALIKPAETALEAISYLDKPRGAIAGAVKAATEGEDIIEGASKGWKENTSWGEMFPEEFKKENPYYLASIGGFATDVVLDPMWLLPPAKIAKTIASGSKAIGLTDNVINPAVKAIKSTELGQKTFDSTTNAASKILGINNPVDDAQAAYNATKGGLGGLNKDALKEVEDIVTEYLPNANRQEVEAIVQRMVESYPDIGTFAQRADKVAARDVVINTLQKELDAANTGVRTAREAVSKVGELTEEEKLIAEILKKNNVSTDNLPDAIKAAQGTGEVVAPAKQATNAAEFGRLRRTAIDLIKSGKLSEDNLAQVRALFSETEWEMLMPEIKTKYKNSPILQEIERMSNVPQRGINATPSSRLEQDAIARLSQKRNVAINATPDIVSRTGAEAGEGFAVTGFKELSPKEQAYKQVLKDNGMTIDDVVSAMQKQVDDIYNAELNYLKTSGGKGVSPGGLMRDEIYGDVIGRFGRQSNNPEWYREFFRQYGRKPTQKELRELAEKRLTEGYTDEELRMFGVDKDVPPNAQYLKAKTALEGLIGMRNKMPEAAEWYSAKDVTETAGKSKFMNNPDIVLDGNVTAKLDNVNLSANLDDLYVGNKTSPEKILPDVRIGNKPQSTVNLADITEDQRRLLTGVQNVPELAEKIKTQQQLQQQLGAVERARVALEKADVSPEKLTQVIDSALKTGFTPTEVEGMFKASEVMRRVNQTMTDEALKRGLISAADAKDFSSGRHLRRMYAALENPEEHYNNLVKAGYKEVADKFWESYSRFEQGAKAQGISINMGTFESRKNLPKALQDQLGRIYEATYPFAKGNKMAIEQYAKYDFLKEISNKFGSDTMQPGYKKVPITADGKYGQLEGKFLPERAYQETMYSVGKFDQQANTWQKWVQRWKATKLINPASINRNMMSGAVMANVFGEVPLHKMPLLFQEAWTDLRHGTTSFLQARNNGLFESTISKAELDALANRVRGNSTGAMDKVDSLLGKGMKAFSFPDELWRMVVYNHHVSQGMSPMDAVKKANAALFDYNKAPAWLESLSKNGIVPFGKFPFFAGKATAEALWKRPAEVTKYTKMQNQDNAQDREKIMPDYLKAKTLLPLGESERIVNGKPQKVQRNIDLSYILPFANDVSVGNPLIDAVTLLRTGKNGIGQEVVKPGMSAEDKAKAWGTFAANSFAPSIISPYNVEKLYNAAQGNVDSKGRQYDLTDALAQTLLGIKNVPINTDEIFKQKMGKINIDQRNIQDMMRIISRDQSLTKEQKADKIREYNSQMKKLAKEAKEAQEAYKREKKRGAI